MSTKTVGVWDNRSAPGGAGNTIRGLTRSSDLTREGLAMKATCSIDGCSSPVDARMLCSAHYKKLLRYGDPLWVAPRRKPDLVGHRFGSLVVIEDAGGPYEWRCQCDCGEITRTRTWNLRSGNALTCGNGVNHRRKPLAGYAGAHKRVRKTKGSPRDHQCVDCGSRASEWSYDHQDPNQLIEDGSGLPYSLASEHYQPRCTPCHRTFDAPESSR